MKKLLLFILFISISFSIFPCERVGHFDFEVKNSSGERLYWGCYDAVNRGPHVTEYVLTAERAKATGVPRPSATFTQIRDGGILQRVLQNNGFSLPAHSDFTNSGYDRGHMAPNADFNDTAENALLTFFIANVWPQTPRVNRSVWLVTENEGRRLAVQHGEVRVVITVEEFGGKIGRNVSVPISFTKTIYSRDVIVYTVTVINE